MNWSNRHHEPGGKAGWPLNIAPKSLEGPRNDAGLRSGPDRGVGDHSPNLCSGANVPVARRYIPAALTLGGFGGVIRLKLALKFPVDAVLNTTAFPATDLENGR